MRGVKRSRMAVAMGIWVLVASVCAPASAQPDPNAAASVAPLPAPLPPPTGDVTLHGAGATFPATLYGVWIETYSEIHPNIQINYQANGSGSGIKAITQQTVDFGATDAAMTDAEEAKLPEGTSIVHIPTALGAVAVIFNLPDVTGLDLDGATVSSIFLGGITRWDDPAIAALNPGVALPDREILVFHRSDGSGTTNAFTSYLAAVSPEWATAIGVGKEVDWPVGIGAKGNDGVAVGVQQNPGGLGYTELQFAEAAELPVANLKNADGRFVPGSTAGVTAAADAVVDQFPADSRQEPIINAPGPDSYPIATYTYLLVYQDQTEEVEGHALVSFISWALTHGQGMEEALGFAPLPTAIQEKAIADLRTVTHAGDPIWPAS